MQAMGLCAIWGIGEAKTGASRGRRKGNLAAAPTSKAPKKMKQDCTLPKSPAPVYLAKHSRGRVIKHWPQVHIYILLISKC